jgi:integrase
MPRPRKSIPSYLPHKQSGRARAVWTDPTGTRRFRLLPGSFDSPESRAAFAALLLELDAAPHHAPAADPGGLTLAELLLAYLEHAERHYRTPDGKPTSEVYEVKLVVRALRELYADTPVAAFGPLCVKAARQKWVNEGRSRSECNRRVALVKRIIKWAVAEELAPPAVYQAVAAVAGLQKGRTKARETEPIVPVSDAVVEATLPFLGRHVRGLVEFQRLTGCRPGEACVVRRCDIDTGGPIWLYRPPHHKTAHRGKVRVSRMRRATWERFRRTWASSQSSHSPWRQSALALMRASPATRRDSTPCAVDWLTSTANSSRVAAGRTSAARFGPVCIM